MCVLAEHERNISRERTKAGLEWAGSRGRSGGRPEGLSERYRKIAPEVKEIYE
jgi:DNA invertase Pin-like site-specific DNA recombinase